MIVDCHGHYGTAPKALENRRNQKIAGIALAGVDDVPQWIGVSNAWNVFR